MNPSVIPSAPNWFQSQIFVCNEDGLLVYAAKNDIVFLHIKKKKEYFYECSLICHAHNDRINSIVFSPKSGQFINCIASCGDDGFIRIWDILSHELKLCNSGSEDNLKVIGLDWSADPNVVISVNETGSITYWELDSNTFRQITISQKFSPSCLKCCPHDKNIIAIGAKTGLIFIVNVKGNGKLLFRVKGHEGDVVSLSWCPVPDNVFSLNGGNIQNEDEEHNSKDRTLLIASGGTDKFIYIWKAGIDMRYITKFGLPLQTKHQNFRKKNINDSANNNFIMVFWTDPYQILSGSLFGDLLSWNIKQIVDFLNSQTKEDKSSYSLKLFQPKIVHSKHNKGLFTIASPISVERNIDIKEDKRIIFTSAVDKHIVGCIAGKNEIILNLPCISNVIYSLAISPHDPNWLAIGVGDSKVVLLDLCSSPMFKYTQVFWKKINGKVMSLAWHPHEEGILAYGTGDGKIGLIHTDTDQPPTILKLYLHMSIYTLQWGPPIIINEDTENVPLTLFAVGERQVVQYCVETPEKNPLSLKDIIKAADLSSGMKSCARTDCTFKYDKHIFAVSNENGSVHIISCKDKTRWHTLYPHKKSINSLLWHPKCENNEPNLKYGDLLASAAENIKVFNIPSKQDCTVNLVASLNLHAEKIVSLAWNPHSSGKLISSSYDYTIQIWDVITQSSLGCYEGHSSPVLGALFSEIDPNYIISGSYDNTLRIWHVNELKTIEPMRRKHFFASVKKQRSSAPMATVITSNSRQCYDDFKKRLKNRALFPGTGLQLSNARHADELFNRLFSKSTPEESCNESFDYLNWFGDQKAVKNVLLKEHSLLMETGDIPKACHNSLWRGDITSMIKEAIKKKQLTDWMVSISPMCSYDCWTDACFAYAEQLTQCGDCITAASYFLAIHKVEEAVLCLAENNFFKEALAIAKSRYPEDDPTISYVLKKWGDYSKISGQSSLAAHCFIELEDYLTAIDCLVNCKDLKSLKLAAMIADKTGALERSDVLYKECLQLGLQNENYVIVEDILDQKSEYGAWKLWLHANQKIHSMKANKKHCDQLFLSWLKGECSTDNMLEQMEPFCMEIGKAYAVLDSFIPKVKIPVYEKELWYIVSGQISLLCASYHDADQLSALQYLVSALSCLYQYQTNHEAHPGLLYVCYFFSPQGPFAPNSIFMTTCETEQEKILMKSAKAFLCAAVVNWLCNKKSVKAFITNQDDSIEESKNSKSEVDFTWLEELFNKCQADVLDPESFKFFKAKSERQLLVEEVGKDVIEEKIKRKSLDKNKKMTKKGNILKTHNSNEDDTKIKENESDRKESFIENGSNGITKKSIELNDSSKTEDLSLTDDTSEEKQSYSNSTIGNGENVSIQVRVSNNEDVMSKEIVDINKNHSNDSVQNLDTVSETENSVKSPEKNKTELAKVDTLINKFQQSRIFSPNPFIACVNIKCVINHYVRQFNSELAEKLDNNCDNMWKNCSSF
uniref:WD repeat-containing protein 55 homolog n=2 Tax=Clastoptera arizonana TaxID=38151 RepID=A0A1B6DZE3_9HEMI